MLNGKRLQVVRGFAQAHELDGKFDLTVDAHERPALGGAVKFGHNEPVEAELFVKDTGLLDGVGSG